MFITDPGPIPFDKLIIGLVFLFILAFLPFFMLMFLIFRNKWRIMEIIWKASIIAVALESIFVGYQLYRMTKVIY